MNTSRLPRVRISGAFLLASSTLAIAISSPAQADTTAPCNTGNGPDAVADTSDDTLECGENATASGGNATAVGNGSTASGSLSLAVGDSASATANNGTAVGQFAQAGDAASDTNASAFGRSAQATATGATAIGAASDAFGDNSTAIRHIIRRHRSGQHCRGPPCPSFNRAFGCHRHRGERHRRRSDRTGRSGGCIGPGRHSHRE